MAAAFGEESLPSPVAPSPEGNEAVSLSSRRARSKALPARQGTIYAPLVTNQKFRIGSAFGGPNLDCNLILHDTPLDYHCSTTLGF